MKKKIAFVTPHYLPSQLTGSGVFVSELAVEFAKKGYDISIITSNALTTRYWYDPIFGKKTSKNFELINNVKVYRLSCNQILSSAAFILFKHFSGFISLRLMERIKLLKSGPILNGLLNILKKENFDIIHCSPSPLFINKQTTDSIRKLKKKPKLIFTPFLHSQDKDFDSYLLKEILKKADIIHVISKTEKEEVHSMLKIHKKKIKVVPLFLNVRLMHSISELNNDVESFKKRYKLKGKKIILFAGVKGISKGAVDLLKAVEVLNQTKINYILIAIGSSTPEWEIAKKKINRKWLIDLSYKTGKEKEIFFTLADIFCMPSKTETFGLVYLEAWHKRKPVVAAGIRTVKELIGEDGLFAEYGNVQSIVENIQKLSYNSALREKLGSKGRSKLTSKYNLEKVIPEYIKLFNL